MLNKIVSKDLKYITDQKLEWSRFKNKTILITGATGFIGGYFIDTFMYLNTEYFYNIKIIALCHSSKDLIKKLGHYKDNENLTVIFQDVCLPFSYDCDYNVDTIDYIIHCASIATPKLFESNPVDVILPNIVGTKNLLEVAREKNSEFIYLSTSGVNFEIDHIKLSSCYIESKRMGENLCVAYNHQYKVPIKIIRPSIIFGPGIKLDDGRSYADFISNIVNKQDIILTSDGEAKRNYLYISDAMIAFFMIILKGEIIKPYNVSSSWPSLTIKTIADRLVDTVFPELHLKVYTNKENKYLRTEFKDTTVDISELNSLGWKESVTLSEGFKRAVKSFK